MGNTLNCSCWSNKEFENKDISVPERFDENYVNPESQENLKVKAKIIKTEELTKITNSQVLNQVEEKKIIRTLSSKLNQMKEIKDEEDKKKLRGAKVSQKEEKLSPVINTTAYKKSSQKILRVLEEKEKSVKKKDFLTILLLGDPSVGKTCFIEKIVNNKFENYHIPTIKVELIEHKIETKNGRVMINFIDTCGLAEYKNDLEDLFKSNDINIVFFLIDLSDMKSFNYINEVMPYLKNKSVYVLGNKLDLMNKQVKRDSISTFCSNNSFKYYEFSTKTGMHLTKILKEIIEDALDKC